MTSRETDPGRLAALRRARARAEWAEWDAVLAFNQARRADIDHSDASAMFKRMELNAIAMEIADALVLSEASVYRILSQGSAVAHRAPMTWLAFERGDLDAGKISEISHAVDALKLEESWQAVDANAGQYAATHTRAELRAWLKRLVARLEPEEFEERCEKVRDDRHVVVVHDDNGMSWLNAFIPTSAAVAIQKRLDKAARRLVDADGEPERTMDQKQADLLAAWLTNVEGSDCDVRAEVAVTIEAAALAGLSQTPALIDHEHPVPAAWVAELVASNDTFWTQLLTDQQGRVLDATYLGYQPPETLKRAIRWRDVECGIRGCRKKAKACDIDHQVPFDSGGKTTGSNLQTLCRKHHGLKGHGFIDSSLYADDYSYREPLRRPSRVESEVARMCVNVPDFVHPIGVR